MGEVTGISWCHHTVNPWSGCTKVSEGCKFCYAERDTKRYGLDVFGPKASRQLRAEAYWKQVPKWNQAAIDAGERRRVFCMSFGDIWEDRPELRDHRARMLALVESCTSLDFLLLTKRPELAPRLLDECGYGHWMADGWPANAWAMVSAENNQRLNERCSVLVDLPARVRGLSCEPLVGDLLDIGKWLATGQIHWAIVGGESGARDQARPMQFEWALRIRQACRDYGAAFWWKQWGNHVPDGNGGMVFVGKKVDGDLAGEICRELPATRLLELVP